MLLLQPPGGSSVSLDGWLAAPSGPDALMRVCWAEMVRVKANQAQSNQWKRNQGLRAALAASGDPLDIPQISRYIS